MKTMQELTAKMRFDGANPSPEPRKIEIDPDTAVVVNKLFNRLQIIFPAFKQAWPTQIEFDRAKREWTLAFMQVGINNVNQLKYGLEKARVSGQAFIPSIGQFIQWCTPTPEELGIPSLRDAFDEACRNSYRYETDKKWSHEAVHHAWTMCRSRDLSELPKSSSMPIFEHAYTLTVKSILKGEPLKPIPLAVSHQVESRHSQETARAALADIFKSLGVKKPT